MERHFSVFWGARKGVHAEAVRELWVVTLISSLPFLIGAFAYLLVGDTGTDYVERLLTYLASVFLQGQLFLVSVSFMATSLYRLFNSDQSYRRPDAIAIFAIFLFGVIGIYYGINPNFAKLRSPFSQLISVIFFGLSILFYYYTAVLSIERPKSIEQSLQSSSGALDERLSARRARGEDEGNENAAE